MIPLMLKSVLLLGVAGALFSFDLPAGWNRRGRAPEKYDMGIDRGTGQNSTNAATIKSLEKEMESSASLLQNCRPGKFLGQRVKMTGYMKAKDVAVGASYWMRVDQVDTTRIGDSLTVNVLSFDNMANRMIIGTTEWKKGEIVLDIPANASSFTFGALMVGTGQI